MRNRACRGGLRRGNNATLADLRIFWCARGDDLDLSVGAAPQRWEWASPRRQRLTSARRNVGAQYRNGYSGKQKRRQDLLLVLGRRSIAAVHHEEINHTGRSVNERSAEAI
jgi:hypothetical protein